MNLEEYFDKLHKLAAQEKRRKQARDQNDLQYEDDWENQGNRE